MNQICTEERRSIAEWPIRARRKMLNPGTPRNEAVDVLAEAAAEKLSFLDYRELTVVSRRWHRDEIMLSALDQYIASLK